MAYRRRQGITRASTFKEEIYHQPPADDHNDFNVKRNPATFSSSYSFSSGSSPGSSLAAKAIRASAAHREASSFSTAYADSSAFEAPRSKGFNAYENESSRNDSKGFWGVLARKAKAILEDDNISQQFESSGRLRSQMFDASTGSQQSYQSPEGFRRMDNPTIRKGLDKLTSSLNQIGDTFEKAFEEGRTIVENKTADIIQETRKLQIRRKGSDTDTQNLAPGVSSSWQQPIELQNQNTHETQLKASRDVAMATAAKAKLLLRELKTVKADLAFAKERCAQLEEENKILRECREKGGNPADDDLIRLQLETLLAEKARLAHENSIYARENRFLREIVEYHQLTMQDVVYLDENNEEVTEVYPLIPGVSRTLSVTPPSPTSPPSPCEDPHYPEAKEILAVPEEETKDILGCEVEVSAATGNLEHKKEDGEGKAPKKEDEAGKPSKEEDNAAKKPSEFSA